MIVLIGLMLFPGTSHAVELGLTPSHVFALWTNVNTCLLTIAAQQKNGEALVENLKDLEVQSFAGKQPSDVLLALEKIRNRINSVRVRAGMAPVAVYLDQAEVVTPSTVFLNSGYILDGLADIVAHKGDATSLVTSCYETQHVIGKTPSDVFGLVDLAMRRAGVMLAHNWQQSARR